jgi:hypothetical protein
MNFDVDSDESLKNRILLNAKPIGYWAIKKNNFFSQTSIPKLFSRKAFIELNIIPHNCDRGLML